MCGFWEHNCRCVNISHSRCTCSNGRCVLQLGGSDQWGNMVNGVDLGRRVEKAELFAVTAPLITTSEGKKMGKSASGAVWLNADKLPAYDYWQVRFSIVTHHERSPLLAAPLSSSLCVESDGARLILLCSALNATFSCRCCAVLAEYG